MPLDVFFVQPFDHFAGRSGAVVVGVVPIAEEELATGGWMIPDSPAAGFVAVIRCGTELGLAGVLRGAG
jgi:hypothetical protein